MTVDWSKFSGNYPDKVRFEHPGDSIAGTVMSVREHDFGEGETPILEIRTDEGDEWSVVAGQRNLQVRLAEVRPASGDRIAIKFTGEGTATKPGYNPPKLFEVALERGDAPAEEPAAATPAAPSGPSASDLL